MYEPTYLSQGTGIHSFLMFAPFFVTKPFNMFVRLGHR